jgi:hypothetical protein
VPHANLNAGDKDEGDLVAIHFGGPSWQALDGSSVVGDAANARPGGALPRRRLRVRVVFEYRSVATGGKYVFRAA